jgi:hypothetical protein
MSFFDDLFKHVDDDEAKLIRSVALLSASVHVAAMNVAGVTRGAIYNGDDVVKEAKRFEKYLTKGE